jgi:transcription antitermination factor NusG
MNWAVAVTWPHYERRVERALARSGFNCYLPKCKTPKRRTALLFPRYVFAGPAEQWQALRQVYGVSRLLRAGNQPAIIEENTVKALRAREDIEGFVKLPQHHVARLRIGQRVRITIGTFAGLKGTYRGSSKRWERVDLACGIVTLPAGHLAAE